MGDTNWVEAIEAADNKRLLGMMAEFAAGVGHELNNPLAVISGYAQALLKNETDASKRRYLTSILDQTKRAYEMIVAVRTFARPPAPEFSAVDVDSFFNAWISREEKRFEEAGVALSSQSVSSVSGVVCKTDKAMLSTILDAIVQNALEAISFEKKLSMGRLNVDSERKKTEGRVILCVSTRVKNDNACVQFVVEDNGPGLSVDFPELVYSPFYSGRLAGRGLGMGLSKAWRLAEQIGAQIHFEQSVVLTTGCRWCVELPAF